MKTCAKCESEREATLENFPPDKKASDGLHSWCRKCNRARYRSYNKSKAGKARVNAYDSAHREERNEARRSYHGTVKGYVQCLYDNMARRCDNSKFYADIECKFTSSIELLSYVVNILQVDPRGLDCHRIDNNGHYEKGNIEFLTEEEHKRHHWVHRLMPA